VDQPRLRDAELAAFVDRLARRLASFEQPALVAAKAQTTTRAGVPSGEDPVEAATVFREPGTWPGTQLQQRRDLLVKLNLGARLGPAN
jgi:hypothetical protein